MFNRRRKSSATAQAPAPVQVAPVQTPAPVQVAPEPKEEDTIDKLLSAKAHLTKLEATAVNAEAEAQAAAEAIVALTQEVILGNNAMIKAQQRAKAAEAALEQAEAQALAVLNLLGNYIPTQEEAAAEAKAQAEAAKAEADAKAKAEAEAQALADAEAKAQAQALAEAQAEADAKAKAEAQALAEATRLEKAKALNRSMMLR